MVLSVEHKNSLIKLKDLSLQTLNSVFDSLQSFDVESDEHEEFYHALLKLSIEYHKLKLSEREVCQLLTDLSFSDEHIRAINEYLRHQNDIFVSNNLRFVDLEWRLEAKIASRSIHNISSIEAKVLIKINVDNENSLRYRSKIPSKNQQAVMTTNATNLVHIVQKLEQALIESKNLARK